MKVNMPLTRRKKDCFEAAVACYETICYMVGMIVDVREMNGLNNYYLAEEIRTGF